MGFNSGFKGLIDMPFLINLSNIPCECVFRDFLLSDIFSFFLFSFFLSFFLSFFFSFFLRQTSSAYSLQVYGILLHLVTFSDTYTQCRTPLEEGSACRRTLYLTKHNIHNRQTDRQTDIYSPRRDLNPQSHEASGCGPRNYLDWPW